MQADVVDPPATLLGTLVLKEHKGIADTPSIYQGIIEELEYLMIVRLFGGTSAML